MAKVKKEIVETKEEPKKVLVDIADLEGFKKEIAELKKQAEKQNAMLLEVADKRNLEKYFDRNQSDRKPIVRVRSIDGKTIIGWEKMKANDVYQDKREPSGWKEDQVVTLLFDDETKKDYVYVDYIRRFEYIYCVLVGKYRDDISGSEILKLISKVDGKEINIDSRFVN